MKAKTLLFSAIGSLCVWLGGLLTSYGHGVPDIVWQTNAHHNVRSVAFSGDGRHLASGAEDDTAIVWALSNRTAVVKVTTPAKVTSIDLSPTASFFVTGGDDGATRNWSAATGMRNCGSRPNDNIVWSVDISYQGSLLAVGKSNGRIDVAPTPCMPGGLSLSGHAGDILEVTFSRAGTQLASASSGGSAVIWRVSDGSILHTLTGHSYFPPEEYEDETVINPVYSVDFSPDDTLLATSGADGTARLWQVADGTEVRVLDGGGIIGRDLYGSAVRFSADGKTLFTVTTGAIKFWRVADGQLLELSCNPTCSGW